MVNYLVEAIQDIPFSESKLQHLQAQKAEKRCLLPRNLLENGFFPSCMPQIENHDKQSNNQMKNYSWSGERKIPSYLDRLVFPEEFMTALRTIAMKEDELYKVTSLLSEELMYGFVTEDNPDDYLMVNYPVEAIQDIPFSESKSQLLQAQKAEMRCLLPRKLLKNGFFPSCMPQIENHDKQSNNQTKNYSWSGERKIPSYLDRLVFPEEFMTALRTIAMKEDELYKVTSLLSELAAPGSDSQPSDMEVRAAIWEACGDSGALQMLVDLLHMKMMDLEDGSGSEENDSELLCRGCSLDDDSVDNERKNDSNDTQAKNCLSRNKWCSIVYRRGQKQLTRLFLKEAEHALQLALVEGN